MTTPCSENHEKKYGVPTLEDLGHDAAALGEEQFPGGELEALRRLDEHMKRTVFCMTERCEPSTRLESYRNLCRKINIQTINTKNASSNLGCSDRDGLVRS